MPAKTSSRRSSRREKWPEAMHWWIDRVGGFLTFCKPSVRIGQAGQDDNDVGVLGDLSACHAEIHRGGGGFYLRPLAETKVNDRTVGGDDSGDPVTGEGKESCEMPPGPRVALRHGDVITLRTVQWRFHQPAPWQTTALLKLVSRHRLPLALDGVLLLGDFCVLGPRSDAHIRTPWQTPVFLTRHQRQYWAKTDGPLRVNGVNVDGLAPLTKQAEVEGDFGSFRWEPAT